MRNVVIGCALTLALTFWMVDRQFGILPVTNAEPVDIAASYGRDMVMIKGGRNPRHDCALTLNDRYTLQERALLSNREELYAVSDFADGTGRRFDPVAVKPIRLTISCKTPSTYATFKID